MRCEKSRKSHGRTQEQRSSLIVCAAVGGGIRGRMKQAGRSQGTKNKNQWIDMAVFIVLLAVASLVTFYLFYRQTYGNEVSYHSDMKAYILEMQGLDSGYSFPYPIFFKLSAFFHLFLGAEVSVALATMVLNSLSMVLLKWEFDRIFPKHTWFAGVLISLVTVLLFFSSMLYFPNNILLPGLRFKYLGVFTANPFHNATYMAARPFTILAFFSFVRLLGSYEKEYPEKTAKTQGADGKRKVIWEYVLFSLYLLLATMTKPSFTIVLVGAAGLIMLYRLFRSKFHNFVPTLCLGITFVPTFIDLLYQFKGVFVPEEGAEGGIGFCFGTVWAQYCTNLPAAVGLAVGFPLLVTLLNYKEVKRNPFFRFAWQIYLMSFAMAFFLYERGFRQFDFNFSWGYMYGIFYLFVGALLVLVQATAETVRTVQTAKSAQTAQTLRIAFGKKPLLLALQWLAYLAHVVCGVYYFWGILRGQMYY